MNKPISIFLFLFWLFGLQTKAQNEFMNWYFGQGAGLCFSVSPPATINDNNIMNTGEGCATVSDSNGNLLFYTDGVTVATKNHTVMSNGTGLNGHPSSTQSGIIIKQPGNPNIYYIFTTMNSVSYSIVDMNLAAGYGSVTTKNVVLYTNTTEKQVAVRHCNGKDVWIINHEGSNSNNFRSYLLTSAGLNSTPIISSIGLPNNGTANLGQMKISSDGKKLAIACNGNFPNTTSVNVGFQLYDFDSSTGIISNSISISNSYGAYGVEFSPDGKFLYGGISSLSSTVNATLYQWNICQTNSTAIIASQYSVGFNTSFGTASIQRAIDGKLYIAPNDPANYYTLHVINSPNSPGSSMGLTLNAISTGTKTVRLGLPNFINSYTKPSPAPFTNTLSCQTASFTVPPIPTFSSGCSSTPYAPSGYLWDFGESSSGASNTSTLTNPSHYYANIGTYTVSLILFNNCTNDTLKQVVNITTAGPNPQVAGTFTVCKGDKQTYTVSGGSSYLWFNNATTNTISLSPSTSTVYSVRTTSNGCNVSKSFSVTVNPCLGLSPVVLDSARTDIRIYPNPATNKLFIETSAACDIQIYNISGQLVLQTKLQQGKNELNLELLKPGMYSIKSNLGATAWYSKLIKVE